MGDVALEVVAPAIAPVTLSVNVVPPIAAVLASQFATLLIVKIILSPTARLLGPILNTGEFADPPFSVMVRLFVPLIFVTEPVTYSTPVGN